MKKIKKLTLVGPNSQEEIKIDFTLFLKQRKNIHKLCDSPKLTMKQRDHLVGVFNILDSIHGVIISK